MTLGERLKQARLARNLSLTALATATRLSKGFLSQVETGATNPSLASLQRLSAALSVSLSDLLAADARPSISSAPRPRLVRRVLPERHKSSLTETGRSAERAVYLAHLLPGGYLEAASSPSGEEAFVLVVSGEVHFSQPGTSLRLGEGDSLTFPLAPQYRLVAQGGTVASLLLVVRSAQDLPRLVETPFVEPLPARGRGGVAAAEAHGPLRLVAMRAARSAGRGR
ncbi:MAG TPA: XRE family transcriptional regulator [Chloroflexia bacterium]|nr:XRE family transcriptional regulator [Chloroflexia bacterium]